MSFGSKPQAPDPTQTANAQTQFNLQAAKDQNKTNSYNQSSAYGSFNYVPDSSSPSGYRLVQSLSPTEQGLYDTSGITRALAGDTASKLAANTASMYSQPFNGNNQAVTDKLNQWTSQYVQPIFNQQDSNLEAQLRNQGLTPGSEAYNNAKNLLSRNQGDFTVNYLKQNQQQGFDQALQEYQLPLATMAGLYGIGAPQAPTQYSTPTAGIQPANYQGAVQSNYDAQMKSYEADQANMSKLITGGIGLAAAPFTGGTSLLGSATSLFGGGGVSGWDTYGGTAFPKIGGGWG